VNGKPVTSYKAAPNPQFNSLFPWAVIGTDSMLGTHLLLCVCKQESAEKIAEVLNDDES
jgi:hypothetical protein